MTCYATNKPRIDVVLLPTGGVPLREIHETLVAVPARNEVILTRECSFRVVEVVHLGLTHDRGPRIEIVVDNIGAHPYRG